ncbi:MAG: DUF427 domain-containing protein [Acidimicrobiales bacterium]
MWDYPRPPRLEAEPRPVRIDFGGATIASSNGALRVLETSHPPVYYLPPADIAPGVLVPRPGTSYCEWKGVATYLSVTVGGHTAQDVAWRYEHPVADYASMAGYVAFYAGAMDACWVGEEQASPQPGGFYGGWVTSWVTGPFKGGPGTMGW